jgi:ribonucleoside-diphosphate reductase alpha chain
VKYKNLVGGGVMKIVNQTVPEALQRLGYSSQRIKQILEYVDANDTIEGAPGLKPEHLPVFDCAFKPANGTRSIHYMGHVKMMAAVQPFISGAISKTVNMPNEATVEDIIGVYVEGWRLGLKAIAIYRDGSKRTQPLVTRRSDSTEADKETARQSGAVESRPVRRKLPDERKAITHKFSIAGHEGYITVGMYDDGSPGEIFLTMSKEGSTVSGLMDTIATMTSLALQYGVPLETLVSKFAHTRFEPSGYTPNPEIKVAKSITDYIFRWLGLKFLPRDAQPPEETRTIGAIESAGGGKPATANAETGFTAREREIFELQADAPACAECGALMVRNGACYKCLNCGSVFGCS